VSAPSDPVLVRRARVARLTTLAMRAGYGLYLVGIVAFFVGAASAFGGAVTVTIVTSLAVGSVLLAPAIVLGYAVKAADRADRDGSW
jgi:uncharacterized membrane protein (DUF485 family)